MTKRAYATLQQLADPGYLGPDIITQHYDTTLLRMLENASEEIDHMCFRHFYCYEGTYYFDGSGAVLIPKDDVLSISSIYLDMDGSQNYSSSLSATDYYSYPVNQYPKTYFKMTYSSGYGGFAPGIKQGVKMTGVFGHGDGESATPYYDSGITGTVATTNGTSLTLSAEGTIQAGHTIRCESEQMYVSAVSSNGSKTATVERQVNGTTAATHTTKALYIYRYPGPITEAVLLFATAWWKQRENPTTFMAGDSVTGQYTISKDIDRIIEGRIDHHIKRYII